jgi:hypothetical protein
LAVIEAVPQHIVEGSIEHQPTAAEPASLSRDSVEQARADPLPPLAFGRHQIVDIDEPAVDKIFRDAITGKADRYTLPPSRQDPVASSVLASDARHEFLRVREL